jgi:hypothetical protein
MPWTVLAQPRYLPVYVGQWYFPYKALSTGMIDRGQTTLFNGDLSNEIMAICWSCLDPHA